MLDKWGPGTQMLLYALIFPALEEVVFRWGLLAYLDQSFQRLRGLRANVLVSACFGLAHLWAWPWTHALAVFLPSMLLGWVWQRWGKLWVCILVHALMNLVYLILVSSKPPGLVF